MKIAVIGTRGIPNHYGGFEQFASYVAPALAAKGHEVYVYNTSSHPYREKEWKGVRIISKYDPQRIMGTSGQFIYDFLCILDARGRRFDLIFQLGYTSSSIWSFLFPQRAVIATNMDGLEWKRAKYSLAARMFLKLAEKLAVKHSDILIADAWGIQQYLKEAHGKEAVWISYGAVPFNDPDIKILSNCGLKPFEYDLLIARMEPENNIEMIIRGHQAAQQDVLLVIIGDYKNKYGQYLRKKYDHASVAFWGAVYDMALLNNLRYFSHIYFHGHSAGGTNPSLLEAMAAQCLIFAHNNIFNRSVLGWDAYYFDDHTTISALLDKRPLKADHGALIENNLLKIRKFYSWPYIIRQLEEQVINAAIR
jgi:glycosyltransferase involved in cell wall biosynthesis